ncbi:MAG TPA: hypothetical protein ENF34_04865 [Candidatus Bathyarchaeota archaeon]|nr:hypothetical protein [Candidatus Bathyarchaeota archaeon]
MEEALEERLAREDYASAVRVVYKALEGLFKLVEQNARGIVELRERIREVDERLGKRLEELSRRMEEADARLGRRIEEVDARLSRSIEEVDAKLGRNIEEVDARLGRRIGELTEGLEREVELRRSLEGRVGRLEGLLVERSVADRLASWLARKAPEYTVIRWFKTGADVLVEGRGILAAVEITIRPHPEDVEQLKVGAGAVKSAWGKVPDLLVLWSESGVVPEGVAELARKAGVRIVRTPVELKAALDEAASRTAEH